MDVVERRALLMLAPALMVLGTGCATAPPAAKVNPDGTYCHRTVISRRRLVTCTPGPVPSEEVNVDARRFAPVADRLTVYVVRDSWGDYSQVVRMSAPGAVPLDLVPQSLARWRLAPGRHSLTLTWRDGVTSLDIEGVAGDLLFVEVIGSSWPWGRTYRLAAGNAGESRGRAAGLRLVGDAS